MVKGISRQVIVVQGSEPKLFEQAIFILKDEAVAEGVTGEKLLKQAQQAIRSPEPQSKKRQLRLYGAFWAAVGSVATGLVWLLTAFLWV
ncbi:MAG: translation initiation factor 2 [Eubacteriales bacterium]|nr:translation initiation factor 2 [Eubacteriales bacterium]